MFFTSGDTRCIIFSLEKTVNGEQVTVNKNLIKIGLYAFCAIVAGAGIFLRLLPRESIKSAAKSPAISALGNKPAEKSDWPVFRGDSFLSGYSKMKVERPLSLKWEYSCGKSSTPVAKDGKLYLVNEDGILFALDCKKGALIWKTGSGIGKTGAAPLFHDGTLFVGNDDGEFIALDATGGKERWRTKNGGQIKGAANVWRDSSNNRTLVIFGSYDSYLYVLDSTDGKTIWKFKSDGYINGAASVYANYAIFGGCDSMLRIVDLVRGKDTPSIDTGSYIPGNPAICGDTVFCANFEGKVIRYDLKNKRILWEHEEKGMQFMSSPAVDESHIVLCAKEGEILCFAASNGSLKWKFKVRGEYRDFPCNLWGQDFNRFV